MRVFVPACASSLALLSACGGSDNSCGDTAASTLTIGTGDPAAGDFQPLPSSGDVALNQGPQGGYHIYVNLRATELCAGAPVSVARDLNDPTSGARLRHQENALSLVRVAGAAQLPRAQATFVCPSTQTGVAMHDRPLELVVTVSEPGGDSVSARATITPLCPANDTTCSQDASIGCAAP